MNPRRRFGLRSQPNAFVGLLAGAIALVASSPHAWAAEEPRELARFSAGSGGSLWPAAGRMWVLGRGPGSSTSVLSTDGTVAGTYRHPQTYSSYTHFIPLGPTRALVRVGSLHGSGTMWALDLADGVAGTATVLPDVEVRPLDAIGVVNGVAVFGKIQTSPRDVERVEPWRTDGTPAGTYALGDVCPGERGSSPKILGTVKGAGGDLLYMTAYTCAPAGSPVNNLALYATDGATLAQIADVSPRGQHAFGPFRGGATRTTDGGLVFRTWLTSNEYLQGPFRDWRIAPGGAVTSLYEEGDWTRLEWAGAPVAGAVVAGTPRGGAFGLHPLAHPEVTLGPALSGYWGYQGGLGEIGGRFVFVTRTPELGAEPWVTDGTSEGTRLLADVNAGAGSSGVSHLCSTSGRLIFGVHVYNAKMTSSLRREVWSTNGTPEGTQKLLEVGDSDAFAATPASVGPWCFFEVAKDVWMTDGTPAHTKKVFASIGRKTVNDQPALLATLGDLLLVLGWLPGGTQRALWSWRVDGAPDEAFFDVTKSKPDEPDAGAKGPTNDGGPVDMAGAPTSTTSPPAPPAATSAADPREATQGEAGACDVARSAAGSSGDEGGHAGAPASAILLALAAWAARRRSA